MHFIFIRLEIVNGDNSDLKKKVETLENTNRYTFLYLNCLPRLTAFIILFPLGGGDNLTCPWYGVVPFLGYLFHDRVRTYGYGFQHFFYFPDL